MKMPSLIRTIYYSTRKKFLSRKILRQMLEVYQNRDFGQIVFFDVGARWGVSEPYDRLKTCPVFISIGFEPDPVEAKKLEENQLFSRTIPIGLGDKNEERTLYIAKDPGCSSLYKPDMMEISRHTDSKQYETVKEIQIPLATLESTLVDHDLPVPDYMKIDCEGAEKIILSGMGELLKNVIGITFEARVFQFYKGESSMQQLVDYFISKNFIIIELNSIGRFSGEKVMFDVVMLRHPLTYTSEREVLLAKIFCLLHENPAYSRRIEEYWASAQKSREF